MGGSRKLPVLLTFTNMYCIYADIVGGSEKVQNYTDVIYAWSPTQLDPLRTKLGGKRMQKKSGVSYRVLLFFDLTQTN